jgi:hypothetical protein
MFTQRIFFANNEATATYSAKRFEVWASEKIALRKLGGGM